VCGDVAAYVTKSLLVYVQGDTKKNRELLKNTIKIEEIQQKKFIVRN
jgi:hypothetical protein